MATVEELKIAIKAEVSDAVSKLKQFDRQAKITAQETKTMAATLSGLKTSMAGPIAAVAVAGAGILAMAKSSVTLAANVERVKMEFSVLTGSMDKSNKLFSEMNRLASQTPLELSDITSAGKQLLSVGIPVDQITEKLRMLGDVAMGNPEKLDRLTQAFGQLKSKGVASMETLNRFIEAGVPIMDELGKQTGKTGAEVFKMVSLGKIGYPEVTKALEALTGEGGLMHDMMAKVAQTTEGKFSTAKDNFGQRLKEWGAKLLPAVNKALDDFNNKMDQVSSLVNIDNAENRKSTADYGLAIEYNNKLIKDFNKAVSDGKSVKISQAQVEEMKKQNIEWGILLSLQQDAERKDKEAAEAEAARVSAILSAKEKLAEKEKTDAYIYATVMKVREDAYISFMGIQKAEADAVEKLRQQYIEYGSVAGAVDITDKEISEDVQRLTDDYIQFGIAMAGSLDSGIESTVELTEAQKALYDAAVSAGMGMADAFGAALVTGEDGWKAFGRAGLNAIASILEAYAQLEIGKAAIDVADLLWPLAAGHIATAALLTAGAGAIKAIPMAEGGSGTVTKPTLFLAGEAGAEDYAFGPKRKGGLSGGGTTVIQNFNIGGSVIAERQVMQLGAAGVAMAGRGY
jgi:tape measure domain-containing protein